jgi:hypothetical protein
LPPERIGEGSPLAQWGFGGRERLAYLAGQFNRAAQTRSEWHHANVTPPELICGVQGATIEVLIDFLTNTISRRASSTQFDLPNFNLDLEIPEYLKDAVSNWLKHVFFPNHTIQTGDDDLQNGLFSSIDLRNELALQFTAYAKDKWKKKIALIFSEIFAREPRPYFDSLVAFLCGKILYGRSMEADS